MKPSQKPLITRRELLTRIGESEPLRPILIGIRGYYRNTMGKPGVNDIGIYDDAIFLVTPSCFAAFNANTDPGVQRKGIATLLPGAYLYTIGTHNITKAKSRQYEALVQAGMVSVLRDGKEDTGYIGLNIHKGGYNSVSSEGCQTIYPSQWSAFITLVKSEMKRYNAKSIWYTLSVA